MKVCLIKKPPNFAWARLLKMGAELLVFFPDTWMDADGDTELIPFLPSFFSFRSCVFAALRLLNSEAQP